MFNAVISRLKGMNGHPRNQDDGPQLFLPSGAPPLTLSHVSTRNVRGIALQVASESAGKMDRTSLLALAHSTIRGKNCLKSEVQIGKVTRLFSRVLVHAACAQQKLDLWQCRGHHPTVCIAGLYHSMMSCT